MKEMKLSRLPLVFSIITAIAMLLAAPGAPQAGLKDKLRERIIEKMKDRPAPEPTNAVTDPITKPGDYVFALEHDGAHRMYMVHVPKSYDPQKPAPLLFAIHGGGGDMAYMAKDEFYGQITKSEEVGFIAVFPNGYSALPSGKLATWNAGDCCGGARDTNSDDVGFFREMVKNLSAQMNIDPNRIYATGMSNGGMMSERLACEMADVFKAIASVAGPDGTKLCTPKRPISVLQIHAFDDDHVLFNGGAGQNAFQDITKVTDFTSIPQTVSNWVRRNNCNTTPERVLKVDGAYCDLYTGCAADTQVKLCVTETGAHSWPGGRKPGGIKSKAPTSKAIDANDMMWNFFNSLN